MDATVQVEGSSADALLAQSVRAVHLQIEIAKALALRLALTAEEALQLASVAGAAQLAAVEGEAPLVQLEVPLTQLELPVVPLLPLPAVGEAPLQLATPLQLG